MRNCFTIPLLLIPFLNYSQNKTEFVWPLDSPHNVTANYGELRPNHFHAGLDLSTSGRVNLPVYAADKGYVSRIKVSASGYGHGLYITHPNGKVTLYGHLNAYSPKIDSLIKIEQYAKESFEAELYLKPGLITVKQHEIIGKSGNTGSSTGPHLHFEVRDEISETPLNPLHFYKFNDNIKPTLQAIGIYNLSDTLSPKFYKSIKVLQRSNGLVTETNSITINQSIIGLAIAGFDKSNNGGSMNNIYSVRLLVDGKDIYSHQLQSLHFDESRYINQFCEFAGGFQFQKCFLSELAPGDFVMNSSNKTRIILRDTNYHAIQIIISDENGNTNHVELHLRTKSYSYYKSSINASDVMVISKKDMVFVKNNLIIQIPQYTIFNSTQLIVENTLETTGKIIILPSNINLRTSASVSFLLPQKYLPQKEKLILVSGGNVIVPVQRNDSVIFNTKNFGWFQLSYDPEAPLINCTTPLSKLKNVYKQKSISFILKDKLSGISTYRLYINNVWVLAEFDAKNSLLTYQFESKIPAGLLKMHLVVKDKVGNQSTLDFNLRR
jgi:hypothetical protein